jgi:hypothetical protein
VGGFARRITHTTDDYDLRLRMTAGGSAEESSRSWRLGFRMPGLRVIRTAAGVPLRRSIHLLTRRALANSPLVEPLLPELPRAG